jgi:hypothetical protein
MFLFITSVFAGEPAINTDEEIRSLKGQVQQLMQRIEQFDLPPKKWTQRRVGSSIKAGS